MKFRHYPRSCKGPVNIIGDNGTYKISFNRIHIVESSYHCPIVVVTGRCSAKAKSEDLPGSHLIIHGFRVKGMECKRCEAFIFLTGIAFNYCYLNFPEAVTKNFSKMKKKILLVTAVIFILLIWHTSKIK